MFKFLSVFFFFASQCSYIKKHYIQKWDHAALIHFHGHTFMLQSYLSAVVVRACYTLTLPPVLPPDSMKIRYHPCQGLGKAFYGNICSTDTVR